MVRHKNRWLLVKVELADDIRKNKTLSVGTSPELFPSKKEFTTRLRRTITWCFGVAGEGPSHDTQIRFFDAETQLVLVRGPRQYCDMVRSSLTLLLTRKQLLSLGERLVDDAGSTSDYCASVISVHGSARTAKIATFRKLRELYRREIEESRIDNSFPNDDKVEKNLCIALQERLTMIQNNLN